MLRALNPKLIRRVTSTSTVAKASPIAFYKVNGTISSYHSSARVENELIVGGLAIGAVTVTLKYAMKGYAAYAEKRAAKQAATGTPDSNTDNSNTKATESASADATEAAAKASDEDVLNEAKKQADAQHKKRAAGATAKPSFFGSLLNSSWFAKNFYDGGFEDKMTKREAALILGVRESATPERVKDAHRRIMQINHPDKGGSAYLTAKVNEAKDLLLKGK